MNKIYKTRTGSCPNLSILVLSDNIKARGIINLSMKNLRG